MLNFAYNALCDATCMQDTELRRNDEVFLNALGARRLLDPTTAGDFCRRFQATDVHTLIDLLNEVRQRVWARFWSTAMILISVLPVLVILTVGWLVARQIVRPTEAINARVQEMASGASDLTARVAVESHDELGQLAEGINSMIGKIQLLVQRVREASVQVLSTASQMADLEQFMNDSNQIDILIVGARPTGLAPACQCLRLGH